jgi:hypothetical protein
MTSGEINEALLEVQDNCSPETFAVIYQYIQDLEDDVESLEVELDAINSRSKRRRRDEEDWS